MPGHIFHQHDGNEFLLLLNGKVEILTEGDGKTMERGDLVCIRSRDFHAGKLNFIHLNEAESEEFIQIADALAKNLKLKTFGDDILADACLMRLLVMVNRLAHDSGPVEYKNIIPDTVTKIFEYVEQNLTGDLSINALEQQFQYNGVYMSRRFREVMGTSLQQYIIAKRCSFTQQTEISPKKYQMENRQK